MDEDRRSNSHTNMVIARLLRQLEDEKDALKKKALQDEINALRAGQLK